MLISLTSLTLFPISPLAAIEVADRKRGSSILSLSCNAYGLNGKISPTRKPEIAFPL